MYQSRNSRIDIYTKACVKIILVGFIYHVSMMTPALCKGRPKVAGGLMFDSGAAAYLPRAAGRVTSGVGSEGF